MLCMMFSVLKTRIVGATQLRTSAECVLGALGCTAQRVHHGKVRLRSPNSVQSTYSDGLKPGRAIISMAAGS